MKVNLPLILLLLISPWQVYSQEIRMATSRDGLEISYTHYGKGEDVVAFVHGWSCDQRYWKDQIVFFAEDYQVVAIDLGGHGDSGSDRENWTISTFGDDVAAVLDQLSYRNLCLVGHSMGGMVVLDAATKVKAEKIKVFPVDVLDRIYWPISEEVFQNFIKPFKEDFQDHTRQWVSNVMFVKDTDPALIQWIANDMSQTPPEVAIPAIHDLWIRDFDETVAGLKERNIPMILVNKREPTAENRKGLIAAGFQIEVIPGVGHFIMMEQPEAFNRRLAALIGSD